MRLLLLLSLSLLGFSCQRQLYNLDKLPASYLVYGQGGGFASQETAYYLFPSGQHWQYKSLSRDTLVLPVHKRREVRAYFAQADSLFRSLPVVQAPGNRYQFIRYQSPDTLYRATWGALDYLPPEVLIRLYRQLPVLQEAH